MKYMSTAIVAILTMVMAVYAFVHKGTKKSGQQARDRVFAGFKAKKGTAVTLVQKSGTIRIVKKKSRWTIVEPARYPADGEAVDAFLSDLEMMTVSRRLTGVTSKPEYGVGHPAVTVRVEGVLPSGKTAVLEIGKVDAVGRSLYVRVGGSRDVLVVDKAVLSSADKGLDAWRSHSALDVDDVKVTDLSWRKGGEVVHLHRKSPSTPFFLVDAQGKSLCRAQKDTADDVVRRVADLRIIRFLPASSKLDESKAQIVIHVKAGGTVGLLVGGACAVGGKAYDGELVASSTGPGSVVFCVKKRDVDMIARPERQLRDIKLLSLTADQLSRIEIRSGNSVLVVADDKGWKIVQPKLPKGQDESGMGRISKFIDDVQAFTVLGFIRPGTESATGGATVRPAYGLDKPTATLTLKTVDGREEILDIGSEQGQNLYVRRRGEQDVLTVYKELKGAILPNVLAFRNLQVLSFDQMNLKTISVNSNGETEVAQQKEGRWRLVRPVAMDADGDTMESILRDVTNLRADRFVSAKARPIHGFSGPMTRTWTFKVKADASNGADAQSNGNAGAAGVAKAAKAAKAAGKAQNVTTYVLQVGENLASGDGCYARSLSGDRSVFVLPVSVCTDLRKRLADRKFGGASPSNVRAVAYVGPKGSFELEKKGPSWYAKAGPKVDDAKVESMLTGVQALRASEVVGYRTAGPAEGTAKPYLRVTVTTMDGKAQIVVVGSEYRRNGKLQGRYAWLEGRKVLYVVAPYALGSLEKLSF
ncbi:MAG: DUF4340 domain-containing protein [Deltaproteobacteria bacterium]|nr:DUF4340 domain-containing protein [Deltaproteobacteria bacterium]